MDFALDKKYEMAQNLFREFAQNEVKPLAQEIDENHRFPRETVEKMAKYGFLGIPVSTGSKIWEVLSFLIWCTVCLDWIYTQRCMCGNNNTGSTTNL